MTSLRPVLIALLFIASAAAAAVGPAGADTTGRGFTCNSLESSALPFDGMVSNQTCTNIDLAILPAGTVLEIQLTSDRSIDLLVFSEAGFGGYKNDQNYRNDAFWEADATLESVNGSVTYRWTTPKDQGDTRWQVVLDNMAHAQDGGEGAQGDGDASVQLTVNQPASRPWTLVDAMVRSAPGEKSVVMDGTTFAEGTQVLIEVFGIDGDPDVFMMSQSQKDAYLSGQSADFRISATDLLSVTSSASATWLVPAAHADQPLYLVVDNAAGPAGGGSGLTNGRLGVVLSILPVLDPTINSADSLTSVDVGERVTLDSAATPNAWDQIDAASSTWSSTGATCEQQNGTTIELCWDSPGVRNVTLSMMTTDSRNAIETVIVTVADQTAPTAVILVSGVVKRGFGESFTLTAQSSDNWLVAAEEWWVDGALVNRQNSSGTAFTHQFDDLTDAGNHSVMLRVIDAAGLVSETYASIRISDTTPPLVGAIQAPTHAMVGETISFELNASDAESPTLVWNWDFDREVDADGDGVADGDVEATGKMVVTSFQSDGPHWVVCRVRNGANLVAESEFLVTILVDPAAEQASNQLPIGRIVIGIVFLAVLVGAVAFWRNTQRRAAEFLAAEHEATAAAAAAAHQTAPTANEQMQMFAPGAGAQSYESLAGMPDSEYGRGRIEPAADIAQHGDDDVLGAIAALRGTDPSDGTDQFSDPITRGLLDDEPDVATQSTTAGRQAEPVVQHASAAATATSAATGPGIGLAEQPSSRSAGITLPTSRMTGEASPQPTSAEAQADVPTTSPTSTPTTASGSDIDPYVQQLIDQGYAPEVAAEFAAKVRERVAESGQQVEPIDSATSPPAAAAPAAAPLDVQSTCAACGSAFEVTLPAGVDSARAACPDCAEIQTISRPV